MTELNRDHSAGVGATRLAALRRHLASLNADPARTGSIDAILITQADNRRYLTGFTGSAGQVLVSATDAVIFTDFRYVEQASVQAPAFTVVQPEGSPWVAIARRASQHGVAHLAIESDDMTVDGHQRLVASMAAAAAGEGARPTAYLSPPVASGRYRRRRRSTPRRYARAISCC